MRLVASGKTTSAQSHGSTFGGSGMPKIAEALSAVDIKRLTKSGLHTVGTVAGLRLRVKASGARSWVLRTMVGSRRAIRSTVEHRVGSVVCDALGAAA